MALRRRPVNRRGAPSMLTEETERRLIEATEQGVPVQVAAQYADVGISTFQRWCTVGREVQNKVEAALAEDQTYEPTEIEAPYYEFWLKIEKARAKAVTRSVLTLQRAAAGGFVTKEVTRRFRDPVTGQVVEETTVDKTAPDWRASAWFLERGPARSLFTKDAQQVELTGAGGGPLEVAQVDASSLAARVQANMQAALEAGAAAAIGGQADEDDDGVIDAELVGDEQ